MMVMMVVVVMESVVTILNAGCLFSLRPVLALQPKTAKIVDVSVHRLSMCWHFSIIVALVPQLHVRTARIE